MVGLPDTKIAEHCRELYKKFADEADDEEGLKIWRGRVVSTALSVSIPDGVYKRVMDQLTDLGCIEQLQRGARGTPTVVLLHYPPTSEVWSEFVKRGSPPLTRGENPAILSSRIAELERRLAGVDVKQGLVDLSRAVKNLERRLEAKT